MPECSEKCPHFMNPEYDKKPWGQTPCALCTPTLSNKGQTFVSLDANPSLVKVMPELQEDEPTTSTREDMSGLLRVMLDLLSCNPVTLRIIVEKTLNPELTWAQIAKREGISRPAVHQRVTVALKRFPELEAIVSMRKAG